MKISNWESSDKDFALLHNFVTFLDLKLITWSMQILGHLRTKMHKFYFILF